MLNLHLPLSQIIEHISPQSNHFEDERINYQDSPIYLYVQSVIVHQDCVLLLQRSCDVRCPEQRSGCTGFYDESTDPLQHMGQELEEEIGYDYQSLILLKTQRLIEYDTTHHQVGVGETYYFQALEQFVPQLNREHSNYQRVKFGEIEHYDIVPGYQDAINHYHLTSHA